MSEFDASKLSEIARIFNKQSKRPSSSTSNNKNQLELETNSSNNLKSRRLGVGAIKKNVISKEDSTTLNKLLRVGRRKRNLQDDDDEVQSENNDTSSDDEEGIVSRTSFRSKKRHQKISNSKVIVAKKQIKNKVTPTEKTEKIPINEDQTNNCSKELKSCDNIKPNSTEGDNEAFNNHKKRKKTRSKQRNIRRDNRVNKPDHLKYGSKDYKGRILTEETKAKLNIPST